MVRTLVVAALLCAPLNPAFADLPQNDTQQKTVECQGALESTEYVLEYERVILSGGATSTSAVVRHRESETGSGGESYGAAVAFPGEFNGRRGRWAISLVPRAGNEPIALVAFRGRGAAGDLTWSVQCLTK